jgi:threonine dehydrogenase-like Zn-dependent dehydrogenase
VLNTSGHRESTTASARTPTATPVPAMLAMGPGEGNPARVINDLARLVNLTAHLGIAGVYAEKDLQPAPGERTDGRVTVPWATLCAKGISVGFGRTHDRRYTVLLPDLVLSGRARPGRDHPPRPAQRCSRADTAHSTSAPTE